MQHDEERGEAAFNLDQGSAAPQMDSVDTSGDATK